MKYFHILIFKYYQFLILLGNEGFHPEITAWFLATLMSWFNFMSLIILLETYNYITFSTLKILIKVSSIIWIISIYYAFKNKPYLNIIGEMEKQSKQNSKTFFAIIYSILTITIYGILAS